MNAYTKTEALLDLICRDLDRPVRVRALLLRYETSERNLRRWFNELIAAGFVVIIKGSGAMRTITVQRPAP